MFFAAKACKAALKHFIKRLFVLASYIALAGETDTGPCG